LKITLKFYTPNPERVITEAAAICWKSVPREQILHHIINAGHWTPLEFVTFNFRIEGVSRSLSHQLVRKRVGVAFCQESQRHVNYIEDFEYITPQSILNCPNDVTYMNATALIIFNRAMKVAQAAYEQLIELGISFEDARYLLPNACATTIDMAINYHALIDLAKERLCKKSQWEIQTLLKKIKAEVEKVSPELARYLQPKCYWLKHCPETKPCGEAKQWLKTFATK